MAASQPCAGCQEITSFLWAAQYMNRGLTTIICFSCYEAGYRCYFDGENLIVSKEPVDGAKPAKLYWDEGGFVTNGTEDIHYPDTNQ